MRTVAVRMDMHISSSALPWTCLITRSSHVINHCANVVSKFGRGRSRLILFHVILLSLKIMSKYGNKILDFNPLS